MNEDYSHNRDYIGIYWNRKYIRAVQAVLNSTKGKIGKRTSFFKKAFGENFEVFHQILEMPETMIIYHYFFEWLGLSESVQKAKEIVGCSFYSSSTVAWWKCFEECRKTLPPTDWQSVLNFIHKNDFSEIPNDFTQSQVRMLLNFYVNCRKNIIDVGSDLWKLKQEYDKNPTVELTRHRKSICLF